MFEEFIVLGGGYFCWCCPLTANRSNDPIYALNLRHITLDERCTNIMQSIHSQSATKGKNMKIYSNLQKDVIAEELHGRRVKFRK